jgi:hypothetical protein
MLFCDEHAKYPKLQSPMEKVSKRVHRKYQERIYAANIRGYSLCHSLYRYFLCLVVFWPAIKHLSLCAETRFFPCFVTGHTIACILAILVSILVIYRFKQKLLQMRAGDNPYKQMLKTTPLSKFTYSSTPALGGMVRDPSQSLINAFE